ncbi:MAG TPA: hypothetical protein VGF28_12005 [Thermoanaerobaculia bacterium]|jgi:hypothetical protein
MPRYFEIIGRIRNIETIAAGSAIRDLPHLEERFGSGHWQKLKGAATVVLAAEAEVHWYKAPRIGRRMKIKRFLD